MHNPNLKLQLLCSGCAINTLGLFIMACFTVKKGSPMKKRFLIICFCLFSVLVGAQVKDTITWEKNKRNNNILFNSKAIPIATGLIGIGLVLEYSKADNYWWQNKYSFQNKIRKSFIDVSTTADDYLRYAPIAIGVILNIGNVKAEHKILGQSGRLISSWLLMDAVVSRMKKYTHHIRPDGSEYNSFPSGHTAQAFCAARFLDKEFGKQHVWLKWLGYSMATTTGICRVLKDKHWISDVLIGAGIGILSVDLTYYVFDRLSSKELVVSPMAGNNQYGFNLVYRF